MSKLKEKFETWWSGKNSRAFTPPKEWAMKRGKGTVYEVYKDGYLAGKRAAKREQGRLK